MKDRDPWLWCQCERHFYDWVRTAWCDYNMSTVMGRLPACVVGRGPDSSERDTRVVDKLILDALLAQRITLKLAGQLRSANAEYVRAFLADPNELWAGNRIEMMRERGAR